MAFVWDHNIVIWALVAAVVVAWGGGLGVMEICRHVHIFIPMCEYMNEIRSSLERVN